MHIAGFRETQRTVRQLRGLLQASEPLYIPQARPGWQGFLLYLQDSSVQLQEISANGVGVHYAGDVRLFFRLIRPCLDARYWRGPRARGRSFAAAQDACARRPAGADRVLGGLLRAKANKPPRISSAPVAGSGVWGAGFWPITYIC